MLRCSFLHPKKENRLDVNRQRTADTLKGIYLFNRCEMRRSWEKTRRIILETITRFFALISSNQCNGDAKYGEAARELKLNRATRQQRH